MVYGYVTKTMHVNRNLQYNMHICHSGWVGVRWGGANNVHVNLNTHGLYGVHVGVGRAITFAHIRHARLWHLLLHLNTYVMHSLGSSLALAHTSCYVMHTYVMKRSVEQKIDYST